MRTETTLKSAYFAYRSPRWSISDGPWAQHLFSWLSNGSSTECMYSFWDRLKLMLQVAWMLQASWGRSGYYATAGTNFTKPGASILAAICTGISDVIYIWGYLRNNLPPCYHYGRRRCRRRPWRFPASCPRTARSARRSLDARASHESAPEGEMFKLYREPLKNPSQILWIWCETIPFFYRRQDGLQLPKVIIKSWKPWKDLE